MPRRASSVAQPREQGAVEVVDGAAPSPGEIVLTHGREPLVGDTATRRHAPQERHDLVGRFRAAEGAEQHDVVGREGTVRLACGNGNRAIRTRPGVGSGIRPGMGGTVGGRRATREPDMQDLHLIGVHEDGQHLLLADADGGRFRLTLDERAAGRGTP